MTLKAIIIEDEAISARRLQKLIDKSEIQVIQILHSVKEAKAWFEENDDPNLIFLDIQLGDGISFEIFEHHQPKSSIIFTTAFDEYALRAFKFNSIDYLLKPIQEKELMAAINKFKNTRQNPVLFSAQQIQDLIQANFESKYRERFLVSIGQRMKTIETKDISLFYSENKATFLQSENRSFLLDISLDDLSEQLDPNQFYRISRQALVHLSHIEEIISHSGSRLILSLKGDNEKWVVSRERVRDFKIWLAS